MGSKVPVIETHATSDGNTQTETSGSTLFQVKRFSDVFGSSIDSSFTKDSGTNPTEASGTQTYAAACTMRNTVLSFSSSTDFDITVVCTSCDWAGDATEEIFDLDNSSGTREGVGFYGVSSGASFTLNVYKYVGNAFTNLGSVAGLTKGAALTLRVKRLSGTVTFYYDTGGGETSIATNDASAISTTIAFRFVLGNVGGSGDEMIYTSVAQNTDVKYWPSTGGAETDQLTFPTQTINTNDITFGAVTGVIRIKYRTRDTNLSWGAYSSFTTIATFQAVGDLASITGIQFQINGNTGGEVAAASLASISVPTKLPLAAILVGGGII